MRFKGVIFDFDGTLIDNNDLWSKHDGVFLRKYNIPHDTEYVRLVNGRGLEESVVIARERYNIDTPVKEMLAEKIACAERIYDEALPMVGADTLIRRLKAAGIPLAIGSGSSAERIQRVLQRVGWGDFFEAIVSVEEVGNGKPDPAVYRTALKRLGVVATDCVVIEDGHNGMLAAHSAGMPCVLIDNKYEKERTGAALHISSLVDAELYQFLGL